MSTVEPHIEVYNVEAISAVEYGAAGKIAYIGAFPSSTFKLGVFTSVDAAKIAVIDTTTYKLPDDTSAANAAKTVVPATYTAFYALDYIFNKSNGSQGPESVLIVNTNYDKGTLVQQSSNADIATACTLLAEDEFDILTIGEPIKLVTDQHTTGDTPEYKINPILSTLQSFVDTQFYNQKPFGIITGIDIDANAVASHLTDFKNLFSKQGIYKAVVTKVKVNGDAESLTIEQSGAWHAAFTAGRMVNKSETSKKYDDIIGENSKDVYPASSSADAITFNKLREKGFFTQTYDNRRLQTIKCVSNITPVGYDMKIERVKNYMIKRLSLSDALGEDHTNITKAYITGLFEYEKQLAITAGYIIDMDYTLSTIDSETVQAEMELVIPDILRVIKLNVALKIASYEGE